MRCGDSVTLRSAPKIYHDDQLSWKVYVGMTLLTITFLAVAILGTLSYANVLSNPFLKLHATGLMAAGFIVFTLSAGLFIALIYTDKSANYKKRDFSFQVERGGKFRQVTIQKSILRSYAILDICKKVFPSLDRDNATLYFKDQRLDEMALLDDYEVVNGDALHLCDSSCQNLNHR